MIKIIFYSSDNNKLYNYLNAWIISLPVEFEVTVLFIDKLNHCIDRSYESLQKYCAMNTSVNVDELIRECLEELYKVQSQLLRMETDFDTLQIIIAIGLSFIVCCTFFP